jgi:hypothetical protein
MGTLLCFLLFATVFCHYMNKWSRELDEAERTEDLGIDNVVVGKFGARADQKRAA